MRAAGKLSPEMLELTTIKAARPMLETPDAPTDRHLLRRCDRMIPHITISPYSCKCILHPLTQSGVR